MNGLGNGPAEGLVVDGLWKSYGVTRALRGVSLRVQPGSVVGLLGENGAGKSTVVRIVSGAEVAERGEVVLDGVPLAQGDASEAYRFGVRTLYQEGSLISGLSAAENVGLYERSRRREWRYSRRRALQRAGEVLKQVGVPEVAGMEVGRLDGRERQLVEFARCLMGEPRVIVLDEPTASLQWGDAERLIRLVREIARSGVGFIYISHMLDEVLAACDEIVVLRDGVRVAEGGRDSWTKQALADAVIGGKRSEGDAVRGNGRRVLDEAQGGEDVALRLSGITWGRLRDISLSVSGGEIVGVIGLAGSEMHSLGRFVAGRTNRPWEGNVELLGQAMRPRAASLRQWVASVGYVPPGRKEEGLWVAGSIRDNVLMGRRRMLGRMRLLSRAAEWELVEGVIRDYGIRGARSPEAAVSSLSGGNQQKLLLARAYFGSPRVVVLDQPTHGIDVGARQDIYGIVRNRAANGVATVVISEDPEELAALASRVYVVRRGKIVSELENPNREIIYETLIA